MTATLERAYRTVTSVTWQCDPQVHRVLADLPAGARVCDLGAGGRRLTAHTLTVDGFRFGGTDLVADLHDLPIDDGCMDCVVCTGTLEHVRDPRRVMREIHRILKPGGLLYVEVPFLQGYHQDPTDYWRWTRDGLELFCTEHELAPVRSGAHMGPSSTVTWVLRQYALCFVRGRWPRRVVFGLSSVLLFPLKYLDAVLPRGPQFDTICSGVFCVARKPAGAGDEER